MASDSSIASAHFAVQPWLSQAILTAARAICEDGLAADSDRADLWHLRGLFELRANRPELAARCFRRSTDLEPANAEYLADLGVALHRLARHFEAEAIYRRAIDLEPREARFFCGLAQAQFEQGRADDGDKAYEWAVRLDPSRARSYAAWGESLLRQSRIEPAIECFEMALKLEPTAVEWYGRLGHAHLCREDWQCAQSAFNDGLKLDSDRIELHMGCGAVALRLGAPLAAIESYKTAVAVDPGSIDALRHLVAALDLSEKRIEAADACFRLGRALDNQGQLDEAVAAYRQTLDRKPDHLESRVALGGVQLRLGQPDEARSCFEAALAIESHHAEAHIGLGQALALTGDFERHWDEVAWSVRHGAWKRRYFEQPAWDGSPLRGRTVLLWSNGSVGDTILLIRYASLVKARGGRVIAECQAELAPLLSRMEAIDVASVQQTPLPLFDYHAILSSLPRIAHQNLLPPPTNISYLLADEWMVAEWRERLDSSAALKVGLAWPDPIEAEVHTPRIPERYLLLASLMNLPVRVVDLLESSETVGSAPRSLDSTAALLMTLDLIITADMTIAHLAGALGRTVWTLLPLAPPCRWSIRGDSSLWYPTMRLFRQQRRGTWADVLGRVESALAAHCKVVNR